MKNYELINFMFPLIRARFTHWLLLIAGVCFCPALVHAHQICDAELPHATPNSDFEDAAPGTVLHKSTGLIWKRCVEGSTWDGVDCRGSVEIYNWAGSFERVAAVNRAVPYAREIKNDVPRPLAWMAGFDPAPLIKPGEHIENHGASDWRLPSINELLSIVETQCVGPASNLDQFSDSHGGMLLNTFAYLKKYERPFWSSSPAAESNLHAWQVDFAFGKDEIFPRRSSGVIRLVRAGRDLHDFNAKAVPLADMTEVAPSLTAPVFSQAPALEPVQEPVEEPVQESVQEPVQEPVQEQKPVDVSMAENRPTDRAALETSTDHAASDTLPSLESADFYGAMEPVAVQGPEIKSVPSLGEWGLMILGLLTATAGLRCLRKR